METLRDSVFGHLVRFVTKSKIFTYPEEKDPSQWKRWYNEEKSGFVAHHGETEAPEKQEKDENGEKKTKTLDELRNGRNASNASSQTRNGDNSDGNARYETDDTDVGHDSYNQRVINRSGVPVDPEKGKDLNIVDWDGPDDPEVGFSTIQLNAHAKQKPESS